MASTQNRNPLKAGLILNVEVENALDGVIMVCLRHEGRAFRGILLDSDKGSCPMGLPNEDVLKKDLNDKFGVPDENIATIEADVVRQDPHSALSYRQSYFQNMPLPPARPLLCGKSQSSPKQKLGPTYTTRARTFKLRPRLNLCSNCKQECSKKKTAKRKLVTPAGDQPPKKSCPNQLNMATAKSVKKAKVHSLKKTLKITYATPEGKDHLTISPRSAGDQKKTFTLDQNGKKTIIAAPVKSKSDIFPQVTNSSKVNGKAKDSEKLPLNGIHPNLKKSKTKLNGRTVSAKAVAIKARQNFVSLKDLSKGHSLSAAAAEEVIANGLKVHMVEDLFVPCSKGKKAVDTSSESSFASSVGSKKPARRRPKAPSRTDSIEPELSDSEKEIEFKTQPRRSDVLNRSEGDNQPKKVPPLNIKIHTKNMTKYRLADGRTMCLGDIVWAKIAGCPWWPARISQIVMSRSESGSVLKHEAQIRWVGASTVSHTPLENLFPFLAYFKERFNRKRKGAYKSAISQAMEEAKAVSPEVRALNTMFETSEIC